MTSLLPTDWMAALDGELDLALLTIPGTHDSCSRLGGPGKQTQTLDIAGQLAAGIRFLDIRLKDEQAGVFRAFHDDVNQQLEFEADVLAAMRAFLSDHPGETVVASVKREGAGGDDATFARDFEALTAGRAGDFHLGPDLPRLGDVRGKIVLVRRYGGGSAGIAADPAHWPGNGTATIATDAGSLTVEDRWDLGHSVSGLEDKWSAVSANLEAAARVGVRLVPHVHERRPRPDEPAVDRGRPARPAGRRDEPAAGRLPGRPPGPPAARDRGHGLPGAARPSPPPGAPRRES